MMQLQIRTISMTGSNVCVTESSVDTVNLKPIDLGLKSLIIELFFLDLFSTQFLTMAVNDSDNVFDARIDDAMVNVIDFDYSSSDKSVSSVDTEVTNFKQNYDEIGVGNRIYSTGVMLAPAWSRVYLPINISEFDAYWGLPVS